MPDTIATLAADITPRIVEVRHDIHRHPETRYDEQRTAGLVEAFLDEIGVPHRRLGGTGVAALIGKGGGRHVALRSELDALPMEDRSGAEWASTVAGRAHACGHDGHVAMLLGTAWALKKLEPGLTGQVTLIWQPAEEGGAGAKKLLDDGLFADGKPGAIFAIHGWPGLPAGCVGYRFGSAMASVDDFEIVVKGEGAHGAMPHAGVDPIVIAARIVEGLQSIRSRMINPLRPLVVTVGTIHGGTAVNIIPDEVTLAGTIRTLDVDTGTRVPGLIERMASETARASGGEAVFTLHQSYPPTINDDRATAFAREVTREVLGTHAAYEIPEPTMGGEDFAYYLEQMPGSFLHLGMGERPPLHNGAYDFNDDAIPAGITVMASLAARFLERGFADR